MMVSLVGVGARDDEIAGQNWWRGGWHAKRSAGYPLVTHQLVERNTIVVTLVYLWFLQSYDLKSVKLV